MAPHLILDLGVHLVEHRLCHVVQRRAKILHTSGDTMTHTCFGEAHPLAPNKSPGGRQKNRRVEFKIMGSR